MRRKIRRGLTDRVQKPLKGSEQERHGIGPLCFGQGKSRIRDQLGGYSCVSDDKCPAAVVIGEKGTYWRHNWEVVLIGLGDWDVGRDRKGGGKADSSTSGTSSRVDSSVCRSYLSKDSVFLKHLTQNPYFLLLVQPPCLQVNITFWIIVLSHWFPYFLSVPTSNHPMQCYLPNTARATLFPF